MLPPKFRASGMSIAIASMAAMRTALRLLALERGFARLDERARRLLEVLGQVQAQALCVHLGLPLHLLRELGRRLLQDGGLSELTFDAFRAELAALRAAHAGDGDRLALLDQLDAWGADIEASLQ